MSSYLTTDTFWKPLIEDACEYADKLQKPRDSRETRNKRAYQYFREEIGRSFHPYLELMIYELIDNPHLIMADIRGYRELAQKREVRAIPDLPKSSFRSQELRRGANQLYARKKFGFALKDYNESICSAPSDSEDLGIGYANRSALYYERGEFELTLANIALARKHNYPERFLPKLLAREEKCHEKRRERAMAGNAETPAKLALTSEVHPRIPFLSKDVSLRSLPVYGIGLVAEQDLTAGDVILHEKPLMVSEGESLKFRKCNCCLSENLLHLIPCPNCTWAMFCSEECLQKGLKVHRFECGVSTEMAKLADFLLGPRMFFHGLTLLGDDVDKLMEFCQAHQRTDETFFDLDYANYDPLAEFAVFIAAKSKVQLRRPPANDILQDMVRMYAVIYYSILMEVPLVRSLIVTEEHKDFMVKCFIDYMHLTMDMHMHIPSIFFNTGQLYPIASLCNHSCDPNTLLLDYGGRAKFVVLRPIRRGEQIFISYGPHFSQPPMQRPQKLREIGIDCVCDVCLKYKAWMTQYKKKNPIDPEDWAIVNSLALGLQADVAVDGLDFLRQLIQRYAAFYPQKDLATVLTVYGTHLKACHKLEMEQEMRKKVLG